MTPEQLQELFDALEEIRVDALFEADTTGFSLDAEQFFLLALGAMETAQRYLKLAKYARMQGR